MNRVAIDDVAADAIETDSARRRLTAALGTTEVALNHYRIAPGDGLPAGLHAHAAQEELFVVLAGTAVFDVLLPRGTDREPRQVTLRAGEAVRFAPGEFQSGRNAGDDELVVLAIGAPRDGTPFLAPLTCPACGHDALRVDIDEGGITLVCPACETAHVPAGCPACDTEMRATVHDGDVAVVCPACGHRQATPPLQ